MRSMIIGLIGNPNSGKTTVFNALTGSRQKVGNWPGVTVERKSGFFIHQDTSVEVIDLPGTYSLTTSAAESSLDERIACSFLREQSVDVVVNVVDANNLERHLYLTLQLLEMQIPVIVAVNMMDIATARGLHIFMDVLQKKLQCPVVALEANRGKGIKDLKEIVTKNARDGDAMQPQKSNVMNELLASAISNIAEHLPASSSAKIWFATRLLEEDHYAKQHVSEEVLSLVMQWQEKIRSELHEDPDILLADHRYQAIQTIIQSCVTKNNVRQKTWTERIDNIVLNRVLGIPIFLCIMYCMFFFAINIGGVFQDFFDIGSDTIFVQGFAHLLLQWHVPAWLTALLANGIGKGINTTVTFIPVIGAMFLFLALLEDSGYMTRAAFVVDRLMRALGLPGKSFVPMIVGFGCNVPAVMAVRTLENTRDRILTTMMSPFMSCSARLAIYAVFIAAFFPLGGQNVVFSLYLIGIVMAMITGLLLRKTVLKGEAAPLVMEMPPYHVPNLKTLWLHAWQRLKGFIFRAGKLIIPICILIGALNAINIDGTLNTGEGSALSLLSYLGRMMTPIFAPMGLHPDNWPAAVGLVTGVLAKEVVIGTLNTLYSQLGNVADQVTQFHFWSGLHDAVISIPANLQQLGHAFVNPVLAKAPVHTLSQNVYGIMYQQFDGRIGAIAYLLFVLLYFPCVSTVAAMTRELHRGWAIFSMVWTTGIAYLVAVSFYQLAILGSKIL